MTHDPQQFSPMFHIDVSADAGMNGQPVNHSNENETASLLHDLVEGQDRQNHLLEELVEMLGAQQRQRQQELGQWRKANPRLARKCRQAAETMSHVQTEFLESLIEEVNESADCLIDGDFMLNEFVDRFGPRLAHMNGVLQVLSQLSSVPNPAGQTHDESN